jgi:hypothetical protein
MIDGGVKALFIVFSGEEGREFHFMQFVRASLLYTGLFICNDGDDDDDDDDDI